MRTWRIRLKVISVLFLAREKFYTLSQRCPITHKMSCLPRGTDCSVQCSKAQR